MNSKRPVSPKVWSAAGAAGVVAQFILWLLNSYVFGGDIYDTGNAAVPYAVSALITFAVAFGAGYLPADEASALFAAQSTPQPEGIGTGSMGVGPTVADTGDAAGPDLDYAGDDTDQPRDARGRFIAE